MLFFIRIFSDLNKKYFIEKRRELFIYSSGFLLAVSPTYPGYILLDNFVYSIAGGSDSMNTGWNVRQKACSNWIKFVNLEFFLQEVWFQDFRCVEGETILAFRVNENAKILYEICLRVMWLNCYYLIRQLYWLRSINYPSLWTFWFKNHLFSIKYIILLVTFCSCQVLHININDQYSAFKLVFDICNKDR